MDMQNVAKLNIPEGEARTIHDKDGSLIWGKVSYGVKYKGNTSQQTYTGKNLMKYPYRDTTVTRNGITFTDNGDGTITANGTTTGEALFWITRDTWSYSTSNMVIPAGTYTLSKTGNSGVYLYATIYGKTQGQITTVGASTSDATFTTTEEASLTIRVSVRSAGVSLNNLVLRPQIEAGSTATAYEPYVGGVPAPNPDYPQAVKTVTGDNMVKISDGQNEQSYEVNLGNIELCKIGDYQDYIYKSGGKWYVHKEVGISVGSELGWRKGGGQAFADTTIFYDLTKKAIYRGSIISNYLRFAVDNYGQDVSDSISTTVGGEISIRISNSIATDITAFTDWLDTNGVIIYYPLATPTDTEITNSALIAQLEAVEEWLRRYGYNATVSGNLSIIIDRTAL